MTSSALAFQVTIDSKNPHAQADWWAAALGWQVEPSDEAMIEGLVAAGHAREEDTLRWNGRLVWRIGQAIVDPDHPDRPRVLFQSVPEDKMAKNRLHLDVRAGDDRQSKVDELVAAGATWLHDGRVGQSVWTTLADPEGNEFCVS
ncbi:VOC family protein [Jongsikchunia kroppenstedtii]|uniref:VOC family protein n=1 Tax=Jongsikchunia kroppenstedtii TaxID=1121721 RepID=UPI00039FCE8D|nr:VOC family protein [Jongsikchunia kroppenstedtii]